MSSDGGKVVFSLGATSIKNLHGVHPSLANVVADAIAITAQDFTVSEGIRSAEEEAKHVANGTSHTLNSKHLVQPDGYGHAVDLVPWVNGSLIWSLPAMVQWSFIYPVTDAMRQAAIAAGVRLRWGGCWDKCLNDLTAGPAALKAASADYVRRRGTHVLLDGPHYELLAPTA